ncbi:hypothetical protein GYMLUDRAFT_45897 [Collybiopsis luxurians FD-317 M1]|uniref:Uncharacterized protein n=1 Tax=Collybiopsis luxurians FD-317 M1 TaxID=944289 RepID=A0A0D0CHJ4_9AGAR|nr:hypothetical protein GYMLUDRAFT_45897 [Collybiopsis luxurians FD-317 M1]
MLFGESGVAKGSSPVKYTSKAKAYKTKSPVNTPTSRQIKIEIPDASTSRKRALTNSDNESDIEISELSPLTPLSSRSPLKTTTSPPRRSKLEEPWSFEGLGDLVWVRMSPDSRVFDAENANDGDFIWWPAKNTGTTKHEISVSPYGISGSSVSSIRARKPSCKNILSLTDSLGRPRFDTFSSARIPASVLGSPRKKAKRDTSNTEAKWQAAVGEILRAKEDQDDGLPPIEFALSAASRFASAKTSSRRNDKGKGKLSIDNFEAEDSDEIDWDPPEPDELLQIPGELILAREKSDKNALYWPARLLAYVPPPRLKGKSRPKEPKYKIVYLDDTDKEVPRSWFYACHEPEFATCQMGQFESHYVDNPDEDDDDNSSHTITARSPSPVPLSSFPGNFTDLSIRAQFGYIKPVLFAILNDQYQPAKVRHDSFIKGGKARAGLGASAGLRGTIPPREIDQLQKHLSDWCLRDEVRASTRMEESAEPIAERHILEDIDNAASSSKSTFTGNSSPGTAHHTTKENVGPDGQGTSKSVLPKDPMQDLPASPALTESELPPSPRPTLPPSSSAISLLSQEDIEVELASKLPLPKSTRQKGSPAYEALTGVEKITYCLNVLLPEAVFQLLLWRNGHRTSIELLSEAEEVELHEKAEKLAEETDWVFDIVRLRETKIRQMKRAEVKMASAGTTRGGMSSRPRRLSGKY